MPARSHDLARAEQLMKQGYARQAHAILAAIVDLDPHNGRAWFLLSRVAETAEQRVRYLHRAQATGYLDSDTPIDLDSIATKQAAAVGDPVAIDYAKLAPTNEAVAVKGGCLAVVLLLVCLIGFGLIGGFNIEISLFALMLVFVIGSVVAVVTRNSAVR